MCLRVVCTKTDRLCIGRHIAFLWIAFAECVVLCSTLTLFRLARQAVVGSVRWLGTVYPVSVPFGFARMDAVITSEILLCHFPTYSTVV